MEQKNMHTEINEQEMQDDVQPVSTVQGERIVGEMAQRPRRIGVFTVIAVIVLLTVAAIFVRGNFFRLKNVQIYSVDPSREVEVLQRAGLTENTGYYQIDEDKMRKGIESSIYLEYLGYEKIWPDTLILYVNERSEVANVFTGGARYVLAEDGMVLHGTNNLTIDNNCMRITGLDVRDIRVGAKVVCHDTAQTQAMLDMLEELYLQGWRGEISELILSDLDSIYLVTVDGYTANIGTINDLRAKIGTVRAVVYELRNRGLRGGLISATVPGEASYRPVN